MRGLSSMSSGGKHMLIGIGVILVINILIFGVFSRSGDDVFLEQDYELGRYIQLATYAEQNKVFDPHILERLMISMIKLGDYAGAQALIERHRDYTQLTTQLYRLLIVISQDDRERISVMTAQLTHPDPKIRSLYLQLRAYALIHMGMFDDAEILLTDSTVLDPLAPGVRAVEGLLRRRTGEHNKAYTAFMQAIEQGVVLDDFFRFEYGLSAFYAGRREHARELLQDVYAYDPYRVELFIGRSRYADQEYAIARQRFADAGRTDPIRRDWKLWTARAFLQEEQPDMAEQIYLQIYAERPTEIELLSDLIRVYDQLDDQEQVEKYADEVLFVLGNTIRGNRIVLNRFLEVGLLDKARDLAQRVAYLADQDETGMLHDLILRTIIAHFVDSIGTPEQDGRYEELQAYTSSFQVDRRVFLAVHHLFKGSVDRALGEIKQISPTATREDLFRILLLHYILRNNDRAALSLLQSNIILLPEIDQLWIRWYITEELGGGDQSAEELRGRLLENAPLSFADREDMRAGFDRYFRTWLRYMVRYYPQEE